jgi:hypothetical protein
MLILLALLQTSTVLRGVTVIDGTGAPSDQECCRRHHGRPDLRDRPSRQRQDPRWRPRARPAGKTLVPGFIDMHAHVAFGPVYGPLKAGDPPLRTEFDSLASVLMLRRLLEWGVTTVRNPGGHTREAVLFRDAVKSGALPGPRTFTAGAIIDVISAPGGLVETVKNEEDLRAAVRRQVAAGVDYVKLYAGLSPALVRAGVDEDAQAGEEGDLPHGGDDVDRWCSAPASTASSTSCRDHHSCCRRPTGPPT